MANFDSGVKGYIKTFATVRVNFPVDYAGRTDISCYQCQFFSRSSCVCQLTKSVVNYPQKYVGADCPLEPEKNEKTDESSEDKNWKAGVF